MNDKEFDRVLKKYRGVSKMLNERTQALNKAEQFIKWVYKKGSIGCRVELRNKTEGVLRDLGHDKWVDEFDCAEDK